MAQNAESEGGAAIETSPEATLEDATLPVAGRHGTTFRVPGFGRWSVALSSERGVALQLIDRANGPGQIVGSTGERDGRLDVFLDRGEYKVVSHGFEAADPQGQGDLGEAKLTVRPFREIEERAVTLPDLAEVETELGDLEQVSWWLQLKSKQRVAFEAAGRHLEDLRLWRDGSWMVGEEPAFEQVEPVVGRPLTIARLAVELPAGLYRLTAYGGAGLPWADDDGSRPLYLRSGVPRRGEAGRSRLAVSKFGIDRFVVPASASYYRIEVPKGDLRSDTVLLRIDDWDESEPYDPGTYAAVTIRKELRELAAEQFRSVGENDHRVITVRGAAGQPYVLQHFRREQVYRFSKKGEYWIDTVHSGHPADGAEATALLYDLRTVSRHMTPLRAEVVRLRSDSRLERRFNLPEKATLFLEVVQAGSYRLGLGGVEAEVRLEPYVLPGQKLEERPPSRRLEPGESSDWDLDPGYYVLTLQPETQGVADLTLTSAGSAADVGQGAQPTARIGRIFLDQAPYLLHQNEQPGAYSGIVLRPLPLDLSEPLPFVLSGSAERSTLTVPFRVPGDGFLRAVAEDGTELPLRLGTGGEPGGSMSPDPISKSGLSIASAETGVLVSRQGTVTVSAPADLELPAAVSLFWEPKHRREPLPQLPAGTLESLPDLPVLTAQEEQFLNLGRGERETFLVRAEDAALYRLESTGLLDTSGVLRTRVAPELERVDDEGAGRNFRVQRYLGAGEYQLTVSTLGRSAGPLGVRLAASPVRSAGRLEPGVAARGWISPDESLEYRFQVDEPGRWRIRVLGLSGLFPVRIEDADGWPLTRPARPGDQTVRLEAGEHRLVVLPQAVRSRHVALVERVPDPVTREGHGPFDLALGARVEHRWQESSDAFRMLVDEDAELPPDRWRLRLSAPVELKIDIGRDVVADLVDSKGEVVGRATSLRGLDGPKPAGTYELQVRPARRNNRVEYHLAVKPLQLLPGYETTAEVPGTFPLRVGEAGLVEVASFGTVDVRARLLDAEGRELAQSDDRPGDWNLRLVRRLEPGEYRIDVGATGEPGTVELAVATLEEQPGEPLDLRAGVARRTFTPGRSVHVVPLSAPVDSGGAVMALAASAEGLRLTLEVQDEDGGWRPAAFGEGRTARLAYVPAGQAPLRLRLEALDRGSSDVELSAVWAGTRPASEDRLASGVRVRDDLDGRGLVAVALERAGCFEFPGRPPGLHVAGFPGVAARPAPDLAAAEGTLWLDAPAGAELRGERWLWPSASEGEATGSRRLRLLPAERATCDLEPSDDVRLLSARGLGGQAALAVADGGVQAADGTESLALALSRTGTATVTLETVGLGTEGLGAVGPGQGERAGVSAQPAEVELSARAFQEAPARSTDGGSEGRVEDGTSVLYALPEGRHRLRLTLASGVAAAVTQGRDVDFLHRASRDGVEVVRDVTVEEPGGAYLRLLAPASGGGLFGISLLDRIEGPSDTLGRVLVERGVQTVGTLEIDVPAGAGRRQVQVRGGERTTLLGHDGSIRTSRESDASLPVPAGGGRLVIEHAPGYVMAWVGDDVASLDTGSQKSPRPQPLSLPSVRPLDPEKATFVVSLDRPRVLHLRAASAALVSVSDPSGDRWTELHSGGVFVDAWLPAGDTTLRLRQLAGRSFAGDLEASASDVLDVGEGLGPEILLSPGATRYASFEVTRPGRVGVAVRADSEVVSVGVLDARGRELPGVGEGVLLMADLEPGRYLLAFSLPADQPPVRIRPAVVGLEPPSGPPEDVVQRYLEFAEAAQPEVTP